MCGIAGFIEKNASRTGLTADEKTEVVNRMCGVIKHRGPDDQGILVRGCLALGMRRLSIIDLESGHQPLSGCDDRVTVVFNGEIYNYRELQKKLEALGHLFHTNSDTETIVHAYEEYGAKCVDHLRGMFAFALWDESAQKLFIARDRAGKKPLYYSLTSKSTLVFASELKSLLEHPEIERETNIDALDAYLSFGYVPDPLSIFRGIEKLPPGHHLSFVNGHVVVEQYWDFNYAPTEIRKEADYIDELRALLEEAVRMRLVSDVPLGAFLSGGIDSSAIVGFMSRASSHPVKTFSIGFEEDSYNELKFARVAAKHFGADHHEFIVTPDICDVVDELVWHFDEPFADPSAIPTYMVSKLARQYVTVVLSGDGGDELFGGYTRYQIDRKRSKLSRLPRVVRERVMRPVSASLPHGAWGRNYLRNVSLDPLERYIDSISIFTELNKLSLYTNELKRKVAHEPIGASMFRGYAATVATGDALDSLLYLDSKTYLPGDILTKVDRMSMATSLEARVPFLDHKLIEFVTRIPASLKMKGLETKYIFKRAMRGIVPDEILERPKQGFGMPLQEWINSQLRGRIHETLTEQRTRERGLFEPAYVDVLLDEHERGRRDHAPALWSLLMLELWHRTFVDRGRANVLANSNNIGLAPVVV